MKLIVNYGNMGSFTDYCYSAFDSTGLGKARAFYEFCDFNACGDCLLWHYRQAHPDFNRINIPSGYYCLLFNEREKP